MKIDPKGKACGFVPILAGALLIASMIWAGPALAHKVLVFAWVEGERIHTESKFPGGRKVRFGKISVLDGEGTKLLAGETDENGNFSFDAPGPSPLTVVLKAGEGHGATWKIGEDELGGTNGEHPPETAAAGISPVKPPLSGGVEGAARLDPQEMEAMVSRVVSRELASVKKMLALQTEKKVSVNDIFGGIGYILGLMGVGIWFNNRGKEKRGAGDDK